MKINIYLPCLIPVLLAIGCHVSLAKPVREKENFGILIDAGSTGSKVKIYKLTTPKNKRQTPHIELVDSKKIKPGVASFMDDPENLEDYVLELISYAEGVIPSRKHKSTTIQLMATAGMRYLEAKDSQHILDEVRKILQDREKSRFIAPTGDDVSVLSGEEEGVYAWLATNYLLGFFNGNKPNKESTGILELGGASTQIAFIPEVPLYDGEFQVRMAGNLYSVYVHSYLNLGANGIKSEIANYLRNDETSFVEDPCMLKGDNANVTLDDGTVVGVKGASSGSECERVISDIIKPEEGDYCQPKPCVVRRVYQPSIGNAIFYALGAFGYAPKALDSIRPANETVDLRKLNEEADKYCAMNLAEAIESYDVPEKYASGYCMQGKYISRLFRNYGFSPDTEKIKITGKVDDVKIDWAMGAMLAKMTDKFCQVGRNPTVTRRKK